MTAPLFSTFIDKVIVNLNGGVRARVYDAGSEREVFVYGKTPKLSRERFEKVIRNLSKNGTGTVDVRKNGDRWTIRVNGSIANDNFEQRLRNVLVNS